MWKTILVPHDFSSSANHAAAIARDEAKLHGAKIVLVHVVDLPHQLEPNAAILADPSGAPVTVKDYAVGAAEKHIADIAERLAKDGITTTGSVRIGNPVEEILRACDAEKADLVVMGTHGRSGLRHLLVGSVAERVVRSSKVPVLTVREK